MLKDITAILALLSVVFCASAVGSLALQGRRTLQDISFAANNASVLAIRASLVAGEAETTVREASLASIELRTLIRQTNKRIDGTSRNLNALLIQMGLAADQWQQASREQRVYWNDTAQQFQTLVGGASDTLGATRAVLESTDRLVSDPQLSASIGSLSRASENIATATGHLSESASLVEAKVRQMTRPVGWAKRVGLFFLQVTAAIGNTLVAIF